MKRLTKLLAQTVAAVAIAVFWCISAVGTTVGTTVGITTLATAVTAATSTPAERGVGIGVGVGVGIGVGGAVAGTATPTTGAVTATPTTIGPITVRASAFGSASNGVCPRSAGFSFGPYRASRKWCQPKLTVEVKHLAGSKTLRHATVKTFRSFSRQSCCNSDGWCGYDLGQR